MILVIEDDQSIRMLLCQVIESMGVPCIGVSGNKEAIKRIPDLNPKIALIDMMLDDGNALPVLKFLQDKFPETVVILTTALRRREVEDTITQFGLKYCLPKPFKLEQIEELIRELSV